MKIVARWFVLTLILGSFLSGCIADVTTSSQLVVIAKLGVTVDLGSGATSRSNGQLIDFGDVAKNNQKASTLTVTNTGPGPMTVKNFSLDPGIAGKPAIFKIDSPALTALKATPLLPNTSRIIPISFNPRDNGDRIHDNFDYRATLTIETNDRDYPVMSVPLVGHQIAPVLEVTIGGTSTPSGETLDFGPTQTTTTKTITIHLINPGASDLPISVSAPAPFSVGTLPPGGVIPGVGSGDLDIRFSPVALGNASQTLNIALGALGVLGNYTLSLTGLGVGASNANLKFSDDGGNSELTPPGPTTPYTYNYGSVEVGQSSTITFWLKNVGLSSSSITSVTTTGDYSIVEVYNDAAVVTPAPYTGTLLTGKTYRIKIRFVPTQMGTRTGSLLVASNDGATYQNVLNFTGNSTAPILEVDQGVVNYPHKGRAYDFGLSNSTKTFTFKNTGTSDLRISVILSSKPAVFGVTNNTYTIAPGWTQSVSVVYSNATQANREKEIIYILSNSYQRSSYELNLSGGGPNLNLEVTPFAEYQDYLLSSKAVDLGDRSASGSLGTPISMTLTNKEPFAVNLTNSVVTTAGAGASLSFNIPGTFVLEPEESGVITVNYTAPGTPELSEKKVTLTDANSRSFVFYGSAINITPPSQTGLVAWFRSDKIKAADVNLSTGDPLSTGVKVTGWNASVSVPAAGSAISLQNPTVNAQPLYYANQDIAKLNGRPYISFDGITTYLTTNRTPGAGSLILNSATATTYFLVMRPQGTLWSGRDVINGHNSGSYTRVFPMVTTEAFSKIGPISGFTRFKQASGSDAVVSNQTEISVNTPYVLGGISNLSRTSTPSYLDDLPLWINGTKQTIKTLRQGFNSLPVTPVTWNSNSYWFTTQVTTPVGSYAATYTPTSIASATGTVTAYIGTPPAADQLPVAGRLNPPVQYPFNAGLIPGNKAPNSPFRSQSVAGGLISTYYTGGITTGVSNFTGMGIDTVLDDQLDPFNPPTYLWPLDPSTYPVGSPLGSATFDGVQVPATITMDNLSVGARMTGATTASTFASEDVLEILLYNRGLSDGEVDVVNNYLKAKYNIP